MFIMITFTSLKVCIAHCRLQNLTFYISKDRLTTLSTHEQRIDSNNSQSVKSSDHHSGNISVTAGMYNLSDGEAYVCLSSFLFQTAITFITHYR